MDFRGISGIWCFSCVSTCFWDFGGFDVVWVFMFWCFDFVLGNWFGMRQDFSGI